MSSSQHHPEGPASASPTAPPGPDGHSFSRKPKISKNPLVRGLLMAASFLCLALAALGVVLPLLPTTPLVILAAYLYSKSSERWYYWLINHRVFGPPLRRWYQTGAITTRAKYMALAMIVGTFSYSVGFVVDLLAVKVLLVAIALGICVFIYRLPESNNSY